MGRGQRNRSKGVRGHQLSVDVLQFSLDKKLIVTASADATVHIWDVDNGNEIKVLKGITRLTRARISR